MRLIHKVPFSAQVRLSLSSILPPSLLPISHLPLPPDPSSLPSLLPPQYRLPLQHRRPAIKDKHRLDPKIQQFADASEETDDVGRGKRIAFFVAHGNLPALLGAAFLVGQVRLDSHLAGFSYEGGFVLTALAAAAIIAGIVGAPDGWVATALGWRPLAAVGTISYGLYLWHWPVFIILNGSRVPANGRR